MGKERKHQRLVDMLHDHYIYISHYPIVEKNWEYEKGELDVLLGTDVFEIYIEIKGNDTVKGMAKAIKQTQRWGQYMKKRVDKHKNYYGVYWTPTCTKYVTKNGIIVPKQYI